MITRMAVYAEYRKMFTRDMQIDALLEEMAELQHALLSFRKCGMVYSATADLDACCLKAAEEIADVYNTLNQVTERMSKEGFFHEEQINRIMAEKISRMAERIGMNRATVNSHTNGHSH